jgi:hypothetical protein
VAETRLTLVSANVADRSLLPRFQKRVRRRCDAGSLCFDHVEAWLRLGCADKSGSRK